MGSAETFEFPSLSPGVQVTSGPCVKCKLRASDLPTYLCMCLLRLFYESLDFSICLPLLLSSSKSQSFNCEHLGPKTDGKS